METPANRALNAGVWKNYIFWQISHFISDMIRDAYNSHPIERCIWSIERCYFQWPWITPNPYFKVTPLFDAEYLRNSTRYRCSYNGILLLRQTYALLNSVVLNDLEWLSKIFSHSPRTACWLCHRRKRAKKWCPLRPIISEITTAIRSRTST